jgi:hypothetical protein
MSDKETLRAQDTKHTVKGAKLNKVLGQKYLGSVG